MLVLSSHAGLVFEVLCLMSVAYLSTTIYQIQKIKKICIYENIINFITKWGCPMESTEIGREAKVYESLGVEGTNQSLVAFTSQSIHYILFRVQRTG